MDQVLRSPGQADHVGGVTTRQTGDFLASLRLRDLRGDPGDERPGILRREGGEGQAFQLSEERALVIADHPLEDGDGRASEDVRHIRALLQDGPEASQDVLQVISLQGQHLLELVQAQQDRTTQLLTQVLGEGEGQFQQEMTVGFLPGQFVGQRGEGFLHTFLRESKPLRACLKSRCILP